MDLSVNFFFLKKCWFGSGYDVLCQWLLTICQIINVTSVNDLTLFLN